MQIHEITGDGPEKGRLRHFSNGQCKPTAYGTGCGFAIPYVLEFNAITIPDRIRTMAEKLGAEFTGNETPEEIGVKVRDAALTLVMT